MLSFEFNGELTRHSLTQIGEFKQLGFSKIQAD